VAFDLQAQVDTAQLQADVLTPTGSATLTEPLGLQGLEPAFRIGLGRGHALGFAPWELRWTYAFVDERVDDSPFSLASSLELGLRSAGLGLWASHQRGGGKAALRPLGGVWAGYARDTVFFPISDDQRASAQGGSGGAFVEADTDAPDAGLTAVARLVRVQIPVGIDLSLRVGDTAALTVTAGGGWSAPLQTELDTRTCVDCLLGLEGYSSSRGWTAFAGIRIEPWMTPYRTHPAPADPAPEVSP
jgi:hypothetical protein